nr:MAG TPA_asm: hypothetical protein [Caudoviricetes sp.]
MPKRPVFGRPRRMAAWSLPPVVSINGITPAQSGWMFIN